MAWGYTYKPWKKPTPKPAPTQVVIKPDTRSVYVKDYSGGDGNVGASVVTKSTTSGSTGSTTTTQSVSGKASGGYTFKGGGTSFNDSVTFTKQKTNLVGEPITQQTSQSQDPIYQAVASRFRQQNVQTNPNAVSTRDNFSKEINKRREQENQRRILQQNLRAAKQKPKTTPTQFRLGNKEYTPTSDITGYSQQQTVSTQPAYLTRDLSVERTNLLSGIGNFVATGYNKIPEGSWGNVIPFKEGLTYGQLIKGERDYLGNVSSTAQSNILSLPSVSTKVDKVEKKYTDINQNQFESLYGGRIKTGAITFDKAVEDYEGTVFAQDVKRRYGEDYDKTYSDATSRGNIGWKNAIKYGGIYAGAKAGSFVLGRFETPKKAVVTSTIITGAVIGGGALSAAYPTIAGVTSSAVNTGFGGYGLYKAVSPKSSPVEVVSGLTMAGLATGSAGYAGYKYWKTPIIRTGKIAAPFIDAKASQTIGTDIKIITKGGVRNAVYYPKQNLIKYGEEGRFSIVTTRGAEGMKNVWKKLGVKHNVGSFDNVIYKGVPSGQAAPQQIYDILGKRYKVTIGNTGRQNAVQSLKKSGLSDAEISAGLRYTAPRMTTVAIEKGIIKTGGSRSVGTFSTSSTREVIDINTNLGIKTRGGGATKSIIGIDRRMIRNNLILEESNVMKFGVVGDKLTYKGSIYSRGLNFGKASDVKIGYGGKEYQDLFGVSFNKEMLPSSNIYNLDSSNTLLFRETIDLTKGGVVPKANIIKTPFSETFNTKKLIVSNIKYPSPKSFTPEFKTSSGSQAVDTNYGKGLYERTDSVGGLLNPPSINIPNTIGNFPRITQPTYNYPSTSNLFSGGEFTFGGSNMKQGGYNLEVLPSKIQTKTYLPQLEATKIQVKLKNAGSFSPSSIKDTTLIKSQTNLKEAQALIQPQKSITQLKSQQVLSPVLAPKIPTMKPPRVRVKPRIKPVFLFKLPKGKGVTPKRSRIPVFLRRFGKFKIIGYGRTQKEAVGIGRSAASKTLGATFKVPTYKGKKIKGFRTKKTKEGVEFIELPKFRLSTGTEKKEIKYFKQLKGGKKKK